MMRLTRLERAAITDSVLKIESIQISLGQLNETKIPDFDEISKCLTTADKSLRAVLKKA